MSNGAYDITHKKIVESGKELFLKNGYENNLQENYEYGFIDFFIMKNLGEI